LTLRFVGEIDEAMLPVFLEILEEAAGRVSPFVIHLTDFGRFSKRGGDIVFRGLRRERGLGGLVRNLDRAFKNQGYPVEKMPFKPHVTLGRRIRWQDDFQAMAKAVKVRDLEIPVNEIVLMESVRVEGRLVYRPIAHAKLKQETE
jgi:2'-5' RNA ligase